MTLLRTDADVLLQNEFKQCKAKKKVNLTIDIYQDDTGTVATLASIQKAEKLIHAMNVNKEYAPILGDPKFIASSVKLALGEDNEYFKNGMAVSLQTLGGSGALRVGFTLIKKFYNGKKIVFIPNPSWKFHERIIRSTGLEVSTYKYYDPMAKDVDFNSMIDDIKVEYSFFY